LALVETGTSSRSPCPVGEGVLRTLSPAGAVWVE